ncbi:carboxypeptidase regulatory-like domain-containing protein [bacterium]|nr:MAG: carboxypeptidase regulatory-like domain-containing protein [bacterium]
MKLSLTLLSLLGSLAVCQADAVQLQIKGPDGKPVAGAQVRLVNVGVRPIGSKVAESFDLKSDATGTMTLTPKAGAAKGTIYYLARVIAPGMAVTQVNLKEGTTTLTLRKGQSYGGVIVDSDDKPVAGVKLALTQLNPAGTYSSLAYLRDKQRLETQSDAQGHWQLDNVPLTGPVGFNISDARFKSEFFWLDVSHAAPPLYVEPGATVKGRLLRPDGKPAAGVEFYAGVASTPKTKADGTFQITGIGDRGFAFQALFAAGGQLPFIVPMKQVSDLEPGEVRDIGDIKAKAGLHFRGRLVDEGTNKPIPDVWVSTWGRGANSSGRSDAQGVFDFLIAPESTSFSVSASGYIRKAQPKIPTDAAHIRSGIINMGLIKLKIGRKVAGTIKTAGGKGVAVSINAYKARGIGAYGVSDAQGKFTLDGLEEGQYNLSVQGYRLKAPVKLLVGKGAIAPLNLVLADTAATAAKLAVPRTTTGRVLYQGQPMAGVKIKFNFRSDRNWYMGQMAVSNLEGVYSITSPIENATPDIVGVSRPGYSAEYEAPKVQDGVWRGDVVLSKQGILHGRVVDSAQRPVANAYIAPEKGSDLPVSTDANGEFTLKGVPSSGVTLFASDGPRWKSYKIEKEGEAIQIVLPDAVPIANKSALAEMAVPNSPLDWEWGKRWQVRGQLLGEMLVRARAAGEGYWGWKEMLHIQAVRAPEQFLEHEQENRDHSPSNNRAEFERMVMLARAGTKDKDKRELVKTWLAEQEKERREISPGSVSLLLELAEIAQKIDPAQGTMWSEYAAQLADQIPDSGSTWQWGQLAARVSPRAVEVLIAECNTEAKLQYLNSAMAAYSEAGDTTSARQIFARIEKLGAQVQATSKTKGRQFPAQVRLAKAVLSEAREQLAKLLATSDPATALKVAMPLSSYQRAPILLVMARNATKSNQFELARKALALINAEQLNDGEFIAQVAAITLQFDKPKAATLFRAAFRKANPKQQDEDLWYQMSQMRDNDLYYSIASYAKARAAQWPGESRILIEREWAKRHENTKGKRINAYSNSQKMQGLVSAMAEIDPQHALEMVNGISNDFGFQRVARADIALALLRGE